MKRKAISRRARGIALLAMFYTLLSSSTVFAQTKALPDTYPVKAVRLIVPYAPGGPTDILAFNFTSTVTALPHVKSGRLHGIAVTTAHRAASLPDLPTIAESVPGYEVAPWYGILLPAGARSALIERINKDIAAVLKDRSLEARIIADGGIVAAGSPESFRKLILDDMAKWKQLAKAAHLKLD